MSVGINQSHRRITILQKKIIHTESRYRLTPEKLRRIKPPESWKFTTTDDISVPKSRKPEEQ